MDKFLRLTLVIFCVLGFPGTPVSAQCTSQRVIACLKPFKDRFGSPTDDSEAMADKDKLKSICRYYKEVYSPCVAPWRRSCYGLLGKALQILDMYKYMCSDGWKTLFEQLYSCSSSKDVTLELHPCTATYQRQTKGLADMQKLCSYTKQYMGCMRKSMTTHCGTEASDYIQTALKKALLPLFDNCDLGGAINNDSGGKINSAGRNGNNASGTVIGIALTVLIALWIQEQV